MLSVNFQQVQQGGTDRHSIPEANDKTYVVQVGQYLDFKYGNNYVNVTLPDGSTAKLIAGTDGHVYFQLPSGA